MNHRICRIVASVLSFVAFNQSQAAEHVFKLVPRTWGAADIEFEFYATGIADPPNVGYPGMSRADHPWTRKFSNADFGAKTFTVYTTTEVDGKVQDLKVGQETGDKRLQASLSAYAKQYGDKIDALEAELELLQEQIRQLKDPSRQSSSYYRWGAVVLVGLMAGHYGARLKKNAK